MADFQPSRTPVDFSVLSGVKLGAGFVIGAAVVTLLGWAIVIILLAIGLGARV